MDKPSRDHATDASGAPQPVGGSAGAGDTCPRDVERDRQNPDMLAPPQTDKGTIPNLKFPFSDAHNRLQGGREVTYESHAADAAAHQGTGSGGIESRVFLRPIASPLTLGFLALGGATLVLSGSQLGWFPLSETRYVALALMAFGAPLQLLSSVFGFLARDPAAATGMGILAAVWLTVGLVLLGVAYYAALALAIEDVRRKAVLPVLRVGEGKASLEGGAADQIERVEHEAGVREQL